MIPSSPHFDIKEFNSKDGTPVPSAYYPNVQVLMNQLEVLRNYLGSSIITINSGYRSPNHNTKVGGSINSMHLKAKAVDFNVKGYTPSAVRDALRFLISQGKIKDGGIGEYDNFTHYDIGRPRTWKG